MYRDDADAARARLASVQAELRAATSEIVELEALHGPCTSREHAEQTATLAELAELIATARAKQQRAPQFPALENELTALSSRLVDLELLDGGTAVMQTKLAEHERAIAALDQTSARDSIVALSAPSADRDGEWVWMPRRRVGQSVARWLATAGALVASIGAASYMAASIPIALVVAMGLGVFGSVPHAIRWMRERDTLRAQIDTMFVDGRHWADASLIRIAPVQRHESLTVWFRDGQVVFTSAQEGYRHVLEIARAAAVLHGIPVEGAFPKALPSGVAVLARGGA